MKRTHFFSGVGIFVILGFLVVTQMMTIGARGSAAQEPLPIPVWLYFVAEEGDTCSGLAVEYNGVCEDFKAVNQYDTDANGDPIIVIGKSYWLHPRWAQNTNQGEHVLYEDTEHVLSDVTVPTQVDASGTQTDDSISIWGWVIILGLWSTITLVGLALIYFGGRRLFSRVRRIRFNWPPNFLGAKLVRRS